MRNKVGIGKRMSCLLLIFLLSINSFATIVSDNDGSAFITKAEFDALKSSFQGQIDTYSQSIDSKIEGAIAAYLAGIKLATKVEQPILIPRAATEGVTCFNYNGWFNSKDIIGLPLTSVRIAYALMESTNKCARIYNMNSRFELGKRVGLTTVQNNGSYDIGAWYGFVSDVKDSLSLFVDIIHNSGAFGGANFDRFAHGGWSGFIRSGKDATEGKTVLELGANNGSYIYTSQLWWDSYFDKNNNYDLVNDSNVSRYNQNATTYVTGATQTHGAVDKMLLCAEKAFGYTRFSDFDNPTRWCGTCDDDDAKWAPNANKAKAYFSDTDQQKTYVWNGTSVSYAPTIIHIGDCLCTNVTPAYTHYAPVFGIMGNRVSAGVKNWSKVYEPDYDSLWDSTWSTKYSSTDLSKFALKDKAGNWHLSLTAGFPLARIVKNKSYEITLNANVTSQWRLWISLGPFINGTDAPSTSYTPINLTSHTRDTTKGNAYILNKTDTIKFIAPDDGIIFIKWKSVLNDWTSNDSCVLKPNSKIIMINTD